MFQNILHGIEGVDVYGVISICLFFAFFTGVLVWTGMLKKNYLKAMADLPLDDGTQPGPSSKNIPS
jgi:hypothetical protein